MKLEDVKIQSIKKIDRIIPNMSSGTGYCEFTTFY